MFVFGFLAGAAFAAWFILKDGGSRLIDLGQRFRDAARRFRKWQELDEL